MLFPAMVFKKQGFWVHVFSFLLYWGRVDGSPGHNVVTQSLPMSFVPAPC